MASSPKYQIFISSTFEDLRAERDQVIRAVLEMGHIPVGMEMFSAADEEQWQIIARHIDESDYYAVVLAHRYGSVTEAGISYTRKEYEYARSRGIPCLGFIIDDTASWPSDRVDKRTTEKKALDEFKGLVREKPVSFWSSADDLHGKFSIALMKAFTAQPREGWVRASRTAGPEITAEVLRLSAENAALRQAVEDAKQSASASKREEAKATLTTLWNTKREISYRYKTSVDWVEGETTLFAAFNWLAPELVVESSLQDCARSLAMNLRADRDKGWDIAAHNQVQGLLADLMTLELVQPSNRKHPVSDEKEYWSLTSYGVDLLKQMRKATLSDKPTESPKGETGVGADETRDSVSEAP